MGEVFAGRYELVDPLGEGGMGTVWRTWDHRRSRYVAAKLLRHSDAAALIRFVREQSFRVQHPHVVAPDGWAGSDEQVLLVMPIVRGGSVATLLRDFGALPEVWAAVLVDQLLDALVAVHAAGLVHRDIKPGNLLLHPTGRGLPHLLLSDFGVAASIADPRLTRASVVVGTPGYLAPEQLAGADPDPRQDLYSTGVVLRELLTGDRPVYPVTEPHAPDPPGAPGPLADVVRRLTARSPDERPATSVRARDLIRASGLLDGRLPPASDVEVFDHVAELPPGWSADGPVARPASGEVPQVPEPRQVQPPRAAVTPPVSPPVWSTRPDPPDPGPDVARPAPAGRLVGRTAARAAVLLAVLGVALLVAAFLVAQRA